MLVKDGGGGFEGVDLELIDADGKVAATTRSDYDGYFLFDSAAYGHYTLRIAASSAAAIHSAIALDAIINVTGDKPSIRLGALKPVILGQIAAISAGPTAH